MVDRLRRAHHRPHGAARVRRRALGGSGIVGLRGWRRTAPAPRSIQALVDAGERGALHLAHRDARSAGSRWMDLRYRGSRGGMGFGLGLAAGAATAVSALAIGARRRRRVGTGPGNGVELPRRRSGPRILILAPAALAEEVIFRGVPHGAAGAGDRAGNGDRAARGRSSRWPTSPTRTSPRSASATSRSPGIFLGLAFYAPGGIWTAWGAHLGWNALLAALDTPVSGVPFPHSVPRLRAGRSGLAHRRSVRAGGRPRLHARAHHRGSRRETLGRKGSRMTRAAVIGAGTMGNGIAHVFAQHGWEVALVDSAPAALDQATATIRAQPRPPGEEGHHPGGRPGADPRPGQDRHRPRRRGRAPTCRRGGEREPRGQVLDLRAARPDRARPRRSSPPTPAPSRSPRSPRRTRRPGAGDRDALHEPGAGDAARRGHPRPRHQRRHDRHRSWIPPERSARRRSR